MKSWWEDTRVYTPGKFGSAHPLLSKLPLLLEEEVSSNAGALVHTSPVLLQMKSWWEDTRVYTPGKFGSAHPLPQDTIPTTTKRPWFSFVNKGPPESPWHESLPPSAKPAHIMLSRISLGP